MKITVGQLRRVINEEITRALNEVDSVDLSVAKLVRGEGGVPLMLRDLINAGDSSFLKRWEDILDAVESAKSEIQRIKDQGPKPEWARGGMISQDEEEAAINNARTKFTPGTPEHQLVATFVHHPNFAVPSRDMMAQAMAHRAEEKESGPRNRAEALAAAEDAGITMDSIDTEISSLERSDAVGTGAKLGDIRRKKQQILSRIMKAWNPVTRTLDVMQLHDLLPKELPELS